MTMRKIDIATIEAAAAGEAGQCVSSPARYSSRSTASCRRRAGPDEDPSSGFRFGGWVQPFWDENMGPFEQNHRRRIRLAAGQADLRIFAAYWPYNQDNPIGAKFQRINKYVLTHSDAPLGVGQQPQAVGRHGRGGRRAQAKRGPRPAHPGQQHALRAVARRRADRPAGADDFPGRCWATASASSTDRRKPARSSWSIISSREHGRDLPRSTSRPARCRPAASQTKPPSEAEIKRRRADGSGSQTHEPRPLRPSLLVLHLEGADPAVGRRDGVRISPGSSRTRRITPSSSGSGRSASSRCSSTDGKR